MVQLTSKFSQFIRTGIQKSRCSAMLALELVTLVNE